MFRRHFTALVVCAVVLGLGPAATAATTTTPSAIVAPAFSDIAGDKAAFELSALGGLGVFTGDGGVGGAVRPDDSITRAEFCKVLVTAVGKASIAAGLVGLAPNFTDAAVIPPWAWGHVNAAQMMGIIGGYPDGSFRAGNPVTYAEAVAMLVRGVTGHEAQVPPGQWPYNYLWYALDNEFTGEANFSFPNLPCSRGDMALMVFATMQVDQLKANGDERPGTAVLAGRIIKGTLLDYLTGASGNWVDLDVDGDGDADVTERFNLASKVCLAKSLTLEGLRNLPVWAILGSGTISEKVVFIGAVAGEATGYTGLFVHDNYHPAGDISGYDYLLFDDETVIPYEPGVTTRINGCLGTAHEVGGYDETDLEDEGYDLVAVTRDEDGLAVSLNALRDWDGFAELTWAWVTKVTSASTASGPAKVSLQWMGHETQPAQVFEIPKDSRVTVNGASAGRNDLKVWDVVAVGFYDDDPDESIIYVRSTRKAVEGAVTDLRTTYPGTLTYAKIDGTTYRYFLTNPPALGDVVRYGLTEEGYCYAPISYATPTTCWWFKSLNHNPDPLVGDTFVVDIAGREHTYKGDGDYDGDGNVDENDLVVAAGWIGYANYVTLDHSRRINDATVPLKCVWCASVDDYAAARVVSVSAGSGTVVVDTDYWDYTSPSYQVIVDPNLTVYEIKATYDGTTGRHRMGYDDATIPPATSRHIAGKIGHYLGLEGLEVGDVIYWDADSGIVWVFNRDVDLEDYVSHLVD